MLQNLLKCGWSQKVTMPVRRENICVFYWNCAVKVSEIWISHSCIKLQILCNLQWNGTKCLQHTELSAMWLSVELSIYPISSPSQLQCDAAESDARLSIISISSRAFFFSVIIMSATSKLISLATLALSLTLCHIQQLNTLKIIIHPLHRELLKCEKITFASTLNRQLK